MFYYQINKSITNIYDANPLRIVGFVRVFIDEAMTQPLTDLPFNELGIYLSFSDLNVTTTEEFDTELSRIVIAEVEKENIQTKLNEVKKAFDLGLI
jgi:hypothetical protein